MSDEVQETPFGGIVRVVKLINGDELIGLVRDAQLDKIVILFPAKIETALSREESGDLIEYFKLTNYAANLQFSEISINRTSILYTGSPSEDLSKMYDVFFQTMQTDPKSIMQNISDDIVVGPEAGLIMLNELFNNEDFVNFVNDMIDTYEGAEIMVDVDDDGEEIEESEKQEPSVEDLLIEEAPKPPKPIKRRTMNPETKKLPYKPDGDPNKAESWSDDPSEYF
jgi:hypothetical protein